MSEVDVLQENGISEENMLNQIGEDYKKILKEPEYSVEDIEAELRRVRMKKNNHSLARRVVFGLVIVLMIVFLMTAHSLPVLQIYGNSMDQTLNEGNIVVSVKNQTLERGDIISFYYDKNILVKRVIAKAGDWIDIDEDGNVSVNGELLDESYVTDKSLGYCDIEFPYQVPENHIFVMGDHRSTSKDSRNSSMGSISEEKVVGKIVFRIWPLSKLGRIN